MRVECVACVAKNGELPSDKPRAFAKCQSECQYLKKPFGANQSRPALEGPKVTYTFYRDDPVAMCQVIRQVKQPCLAFKIIGAGRRCASQDMVREAFEFAFKHIKPTDAVIVGMYPRKFDQVRANAAYVRELGAAI